MNAGGAPRAAWYVGSARMKTPLTARFQAERARFALVHACEDCVYFDPGADEGGGACSHGYPTAPHRRAAFAPDAAPHGMFCKEFEIA